MPEEIKVAARHWDEFIHNYAERVTGLFWWEIPEIIREINRRVSGHSDLEWWKYALHKHFAARLPMQRCLLLGCGDGNLERGLAREGAFVACDAYDISEESLSKARMMAQQEGFSHIRYLNADVNLLHLPVGAYDAVWVSGAMHHFRELEHVIRQVRLGLKPGGLLLMGEYLGAARFQFPKRQKEIADHILNLFPQRFRSLSAEAVHQEDEAAASIEKKNRKHTIPSYKKARLWRRLTGVTECDRAPDPPPISLPTQLRFRSTVGFPSLDAVISSDPTEAVRSDEILRLLKCDFEVIERIDVGGSIYQFLFAGIAHHFVDEDPQTIALVRMALQIEDTLIRIGELSSDFVYLVSRPK